jgi:hypothetical protein
MKKLTLSLAIIFGMAFGGTAQQSGMFSNENNGGGLFQRGYVSAEGYYNRDALMPGLPSHLMEENQDAPLGGGIAVLLSMGVVYAFTKKRKEG